MTYGKRKKEVHNGTDDIISGLPRNIVDTILELMPMRDAARTSILSRNWRYIWASHPKLVLDKDFFMETSLIQSRIISSDKFERLINKLLFHHTCPISRFSLYVPEARFVQSGLIDQWMQFLSRNGIMELTIDSADHIKYHLPSCIFSCQELKHLTLSNFKLPHLSGGFRNLISLHLKGISFAVNSFGTQVVSAPLLEHLTFVSCNGIHHFKLSAPKPRELHVFGCFIWYRNISNLEIVNIKLGKEFIITEQGKSFSLINYFGDLHRVKGITFDGFFLKLLAAETVPKRLPTTVNHLISLDLHNLEFNDVGQISCSLCLLRSSPNLMRLDIYVRVVRQAIAITGNALQRALHYLEAQDSMDQTLNKLQTVRIFSSKGSRSELLFIKLLLACSPSLEKLIIERSKEVFVNEGFRISRELMRFSRASTRAELIYLDPSQQ